MDQIKLEKMRKLKEMGINPYPYSYDQTHHSEQIIESFSKLEGKSVSVAGRIVGMREMGKLYFLDLLDGSGKIQLLGKSDVMAKEAQEIIKLTDVGDILGVEGKVIKTQRGAVSIEISQAKMLAKSLRFLPEKFHGLTDVELRYRKRYLDLIMNPESRNTFTTRAKVINYIRSFLNNRGYLEVETPVLQPVYGGAAAKPFTTHHNYLDTKLYLRISDELYLKRLIIGGMERVYELSKDFRNEAVDASHNPEFTMLEFYQAYGDYNTFMDLLEEMMSGMVKEIKGSHEIDYQGKKVSFKPPFRRIYLVDEILKKSGIDISKMDDKEAERVAAKEKLDIPTKNAVHVADALFDKYVQGELENPTFVLDYPSYMCPLTKDKRGNDKLSERFELFIAGKELSNNYSELTDPVEQNRKFRDQESERKRGDDEAPPRDEDFLEAMEYGMPPTAGCGIGIDRLVYILTDAPSIKEVILFPTVKSDKKAGGSEKKD
ncbi:MAG: lysine--tRNA ligase [Candidatus Micrarchaeota archaeon]|nr:lysine--tRNA ligase [Candidatus Micrarchaeota archaeon]MDE1847874.1 lysine--tRNA ligase [Candidatus Micrarchaeota archaeon]MDE1864201.1 lysine--tRNA ligase [Candidatus Micrarchaeota archaeon]